MPRGTKCRQICAEYEHKVFSPQNCEKTYITVSIDELEAMRLCDLEGLDQEDCAKRMGVSRGTYQRILYAARQKVAEALTEGKGIILAGGHYQVASEDCQFVKKCHRCKRMNEEDRRERHE